VGARGPAARGEPAREQGRKQLRHRGRVSTMT
jgi:hypothetical protein